MFDNPEPDHLLNAAEQYLERGFQVVPLDGKKPNVKGWTQTNYDHHQLGEHLARAKEPGIGVKMGPDSGIIDVEYDTPEQKKIADALCSGLPHFKSKNGGHYIAAYDPRFDGCGNTVDIKCEGQPLKTRIGNGAQSAFPPSKDKEWTTPLDEHIPPAPEPLVAAILAAKPNVARAIESMKRIEIAEESDGSKRLLRAAIKAVEHDLNDTQAVHAIQTYLAAQPPPKNGVLRKYSNESMTRRIATMSSVALVRHIGSATRSTRKRRPCSN